MANIICKKGFYQTLARIDYQEFIKKMNAKTGGGHRLSIWVEYYFYKFCRFRGPLRITLLGDYVLPSPT